MFKKKILLGSIPLLGILALGAIGSITLNNEDVKPISAEETVTAISSIRAKKYRRIDDYDYGYLYQNNEVNSQSDVLSAKEQIENATEGLDEDIEYTVITVELYNNSSLDYTILSFGTRYEVLLNGHTWTLSAESSWELLCEKFTLKGDGGIINSCKSNNGVFLITCEDSYNSKIEVFNTTFNNFECDNCALFNIEGNFEEDNKLSVNFDKCSFSNCKTQSNGGVISITRTYTAKIDNCSFEKCSAKFGGAIYLEDSLYKVQLNGCTFTNCNGEYGGGICVSRKERKFNYPFFFELNSCLAKGCNAQDGGFAYIDAEDIDFCAFYSDSIIENCTATGNGGGVCVSTDKVNVEGFNFENCTAECGNAIYIEGIANSVIDCLFKNCKTSKNAYAIYCLDPIVDDNNEFLDENGEPIDPNPVYLDSINQQESETNYTYVSLWVMGSLIAAAIIGSAVTYFIVFRKKDNK